MNLLKSAAKQSARLSLLASLALLALGLLSGEGAALNMTFYEKQAGKVSVNYSFSDPAALDFVAAESGSDPAEITLCITQDRQRSVLEISDRGSGMQELALAGALLPFYTTKPCGSGIGLPLCREIIDAHDGQLFLSNRAGGGLRVSITLPLKR